MQPWTLREILEATGAAPNSALENELVCAGVSTDSRSVGRGELFIPLVGENFDGHAYVRQALDGGAAAALWHLPEAPPPGPVLRVADTLQAYQDLGSHHLHRRLSLPVAAVTGSTGKTTTKDMLAALLAPLGPGYKTPGNYNNDIGVARCLLELTPEHRWAVLEMAMRGPGQIRRLARMVRPQVGVITNIGVSHIELLGSREGIADAKAELLEYVTDCAVLPYDDLFFERLRKAARSPVVAYSSRVGQGDLAPAQAVNQGLEGWQLEVQGVSFRLPLPGPHMLSDFMGALAVALRLGVSLGDAAAAARTMKLSSMRLEVTRLTDGTCLLNDAYNAAPDSMRGALEVLGYALGRKLAVLGDMLELGPVEEAAHLELGRAAAQSGIDVLLAVGPRSRAMAEEARRSGISEVYWAPDTEAARPLLERHLRPGDTVLLKASRGIGLDRLADCLGAVHES